MTPEEQEYLKSIAVVAAGAGVLGGALVSSVVSLLNGWRQRVSDSKRYRTDSDAASIRHFRELALQAALAQWEDQKIAFERWRNLNPLIQMRTEAPDLDSLDLLLVEKIALLQQFGEGALSPDEFAKRIKGFSSIGKSLRDGQNQEE